MRKAAREAAGVAPHCRFGGEIAVLCGGGNLFRRD
jgi:hypothetical protein